MRVGLYIVFSLLFIIAVAVGVYLINPGTYSFEVFGINLPKLPISLWVAIPVALLAIFSVLHMMFYGTKNFFFLRKWRADAKKLEDAMYWSLIKEPTVTNYANKEIEQSASLLSSSYIEPVDLDSLNTTERLKETAKVIKKIESGEYVDLKNQKFAKHLGEGNPIIEQNNLNHLEAEPKFALKVVDFKDKYSQSVIEKALDKLAQTQDFYTLKKYAKELGKKRFFKLLDRVKNGEDIGFSIDMLKSFMQNYDLTCQDYYQIAILTLEKLDPDSNLEFFKELSNKDEKAIPAYLYILFKYEMLDKVQEILDEHNENEYKAFRALYALKKSKQNYKAADIISKENICK